MFAGDICLNVIGLGYSILNEDWAWARQSILHVATYRFEQAVLGMEIPLTDGLIKKVIGVSKYSGRKVTFLILTEIICRINRTFTHQN